MEIIPVVLVNCSRIIGFHVLLVPHSEKSQGRRDLKTVNFIFIDATRSASMTKVGCLQLTQAEVAPRLPAAITGNKEQANLTLSSSQFAAPQVAPPVSTTLSQVSALRDNDTSIVHGDMERRIASLNDSTLPTQFDEHFQKSVRASTPIAKTGTRRRTACTQSAQSRVLPGRRVLLPAELLDNMQCADGSDSDPLCSPTPPRSKALRVTLQTSRSINAKHVPRTSAKRL